MKRWFVALLVLLLSAQTAVAAVCRHCEHAAHADDGDPLAVDALADGTASAPHGDDPGAGTPAETAAIGSADRCAVCHLGGASIPTDVTWFHVAAAFGRAPPAPVPVYDPAHIERIPRVPLTLPASL